MNTTYPYIPGYDAWKAAAAREREAAQGARDMRDALEYAFAQKSPKFEPPSNAAAMRESIETMRRYAMLPQEELSLSLLQRTIHEKCDAALAAPARNCDVGTAEEQAARFKAFCLPRVGKCSENSKCPAKHPCNQIGIQYCQLKWAQMPFAPAKGKEDNQ